MRLLLIRHGESEGDVMKIHEGRADLQLTEKGKASAAKICNISEYLEVYNLVKKLQTDIYTDVMYPNALRPDENPGYKTKYKG
jgi:bisphosphoglycerate-dependent phosphoglycerate mutase